MAILLALPASTLPTKPPPNPQNLSHAELPLHLLLERCTHIAELKQIHARMIRTGAVSDPLLARRLASSYAAAGLPSLAYARKIFDQIPSPTTFTSNSIIRGYTNNDAPRDALSFYVHLLKRNHLPDSFTFPSLFKCCGELEVGMQLHCHAIKFGFSSDTYINNTLMNMYSVCGCLSSACRVFDKMPLQTIVSWATMIAAYTKSDRALEALELYRRMELDNVEPNEITLVNVLTACARARDLDTGRRVHEYIKANGIGFNPKLSAALLDVYCKCGKVAVASNLFNEMPEKNLFCWNIMIKGHVEDSDYKEALALFHAMQLKGIKADKVTMASLVLACSHLGALELGKWLHAYISRENVEVDVVLGTALVDMYAKCGCTETAIKFFMEMPCKDLMTWTALIGGLATCGQGERALEIFYEMQRSRVKPDAVTFIGVLTACGHAGRVDEGILHFESMSSVYRIQPSIEHYGCVVDLFSRSGLIERAEEFLRKMPMAPDYYVLKGFLRACRIHGNMEVAERTALKLIELNPRDAGTYVLVSNIYDSLKKSDEANRIRDLMLERNIRKPVGCSLLEVDGEVHEFITGDGSHPRSAEIYLMVEDMISQLKEAGYEPNRSQVLLDMDVEEKESARCPHSEKLAIAFGLITTSPGVPIRIMKNLCICNDCHEATKLITKIFSREIFVRDRCRFHHFKDGSCSCKDFW